METVSSLPRSQKLIPCPYTDLDQSSPHPSYLLKVNLILSSHLALGLPSGLFPSGFPTET